MIKEEKREAAQKRFIEKSTALHEGKYDYSKVRYTGVSGKVCIICPEHGEFWQTAGNHCHVKNREGCPKCGNRKKADYHRKSLTDFIREASRTHGSRYDYSKVEYINARTKVCIICPVHGEFWQIPDNHISKAYGCPLCHESRGERKIALALKSMNISFEREKRFTDDYGLKGWPLPYDFWIPASGLLVELQGKQHYEPVQFGGISREKAEELFLERKELDSLKRLYAKDKNIRLLEIPYTEKEPGKLLTSTLQELSAGSAGSASSHISGS